MAHLISICLCLGLIALTTGGSIDRGAAQGISEASASETIAAGSAIAEHSSSISVQGQNGDGWGSGAIPALVSLGTGSSVGMSQYADSYQNSQIDADGTSSGYQGTGANHYLYSDEYLYGDVQGVNATVASSGWTAAEGTGAAAQAAALDHTNSGNSGWKKP